MNIGKTKYICIRQESEDIQVENNNTVKLCDNYKYSKYLQLKSEKNSRDEAEIRDCITQGRIAVKWLNSIWWNNRIMAGRKLNIYNTIVKSLMLYEVETRRQTKGIKRDLMHQKWMFFRLCRISTKLSTK